MPHAQPLISTIIPLFNSAATIERTLRSVMEQAETSVEIIVVNDGSTDEGSEVVAALARRDPRVQRIDQENQGLPGARNTGLDAARGRFVHFLDADDTIEPHAYVRLIGAAERGGAGAAVAGHAVRAMDGSALDTVLLCRAEVSLDDLVDRVGFVCHAPLVARERIGSIRFDTTFRSYEDLDFWFRLGESGLRWTVVDEPLATYTMRPNSMSRNFAVMLSAAQDAVCNLFERQRAISEPARLMDASLERRDRRLTHFALAYATQTVMLHAGVEGAIELLAGSRGRVWITPEQAAEKAHHGFTYALGRAYDDDLEAEAPVLGPLVEFWRRCEARGWAAPGLATDTPRFLEFIRHEHALIADEIVRALHGAPGVTIIGYGRNGALLAQRARAAGLRVLIRDDRFEGPGAPRPASFVVEPMDAPFREGEPVVLTPLDDDALAARFAHSDRIIRWSEVRRTMLSPARAAAG